MFFMFWKVSFIVFMSLLFVLLRKLLLRLVVAWFVAFLCVGWACEKCGSVWSFVWSLFKESLMFVLVFLWSLFCWVIRWLSVNEMLMRFWFDGVVSASNRRRFIRLLSLFGIFWINLVMLFVLFLMVMVVFFMFFVVFFFYCLILLMLVSRIGLIWLIRVLTIDSAAVVGMLNFVILMYIEMGFVVMLMIIVFGLYLIKWIEFGKGILWLGVLYVIVGIVVGRYILVS